MFTEGARNAHDLRGTVDNLTVDGFRHNDEIGPPRILRTRNQWDRETYFTPKGYTLVLAVIIGATRSEVGGL